MHETPVRRRLNNVAIRMIARMTHKKGAEKLRARECNPAGRCPDGFTGRLPVLL